MSNYNMNDIESMVEDWYELKKEMKELVKRDDQYKKIFTKVLNKNDVNTIDTDDYRLTLRNQKRKYLSKELIPKNIVDDYLVERECKMFYIKKH